MDPGVRRRNQQHEHNNLFGKRHQMLVTHCNITITTTSTSMKLPTLGSEEQWQGEHTTRRRGRN